MAVREERLAIGPAARRLEARLVLPEAPRLGAVLCHPHPQYGGDMDNPVVFVVARALAGAGIAALRFDFGGVRGSGGVYGGGPEEVDDVRAALAALAARLPAGTPLVLVGYSFGAWVVLRAAAEGADVRAVIAIGPPVGFLGWEFLPAVTCPVTIVAGDQDRFCPLERCLRLFERTGGRVAVHTLPGTDHFLAGREDEVARLCLDALTPAPR